MSLAAVRGAEFDGSYGDGKLWEPIMILSAKTTALAIILACYPPQFFTLNQFRVNFELRLAERTPDLGLVEATVANTDENLPASGSHHHQR